MEWSPIIYHLDKDGKRDEIFKIKIQNTWQSAADDHAMIDHIKL